LEYPLLVAHLNHQLRPESSREAERVRFYAESLGWPCAVGKEDTRAFSNQQALSIEEAARELRYRFLFSTAEKYGAKAVLVAHHADDQVETVLMHLLRGSGLSGLGGMPSWGLTHWHEQIPLVRPLLDVPRDEIEDYCRENELETIEDSSNKDTTYYRNRLRHELIPYLEGYNPQIRTLIKQMAETLREDNAVLSTLTEGVMVDCQVEAGHQFIALDQQKFHQHPLGLQRNLIRHAIGILRPGLRDIGFQAVERALHHIEKPPKSGQVDLIAGLRLQIEDDRFIIADWNADLLRADWPQWSGETIKMIVPGMTRLDEGWVVKSDLLPKERRFLEVVTANPDPFTAYFDIDPRVTPLTIHTRQPGDRLNPLGMDEGSVKIGDLMINAKLPRRARSRWPLVLVAGRVIWVPGIRQSAQYAVRENTEMILKLSVEKKG
jgi:tRNA(Ile)-lysidine synthase